MQNKEDTKKLLIASNLFSGLGSTAALCCTGPGLIVCSLACAPSCGSLGFSLFGVSSSALTSYIGDYWFVFLGLSIICFAIAFYRLFLKENCSKKRSPKIIFIISLVVSILAYIYPYFG